MLDCILARQRNGAWQLLAPTTAATVFTLVAFGEAFWNDLEGRWTRPDRDDFEMAERTFSILHGDNRRLSHFPTATREVR